MPQYHNTHSCANEKEFQLPPGLSSHHQNDTLELSECHSQEMPLLRVYWQILGDFLKKPKYHAQLISPSSCLGTARCHKGFTVFSLAQCVWINQPRLVSQATRPSFQMATQSIIRRAMSNLLVRRTVLVVSSPVCADRVFGSAAAATRKFGLTGSTQTFSISYTSAGVCVFRALVLFLAI